MRRVHTIDLTAEPRLNLRAVPKHERKQYDQQDEQSLDSIGWREARAQNFWDLVDAAVVLFLLLLAIVGVAA
jgi:hypothetical protein